MLEPLVAEVASFSISTHYMLAGGVLDAQGRAGLYDAVSFLNHHLDQAQTQLCRDSSIVSARLVPVLLLHPLVLA